MREMNLNGISSAELSKMLRVRRQQERHETACRKKAYEQLKEDFMEKLFDQTRGTVDMVRKFYRMVVGETSAFYEVMKEYGALRTDGQRGFSVQHGDFRLEVKHTKVKKFDERADIAAARLIDFLRRWIERRESGSDDPMYQLAMTLLERNNYGDLDYKSISKLYQLESGFKDDEYSDIMRLFRESNVIDSTSVNFYFYERNKMGVWKKLEPSFNRM